MLRATAEQLQAAPESSRMHCHATSFAAQRCDSFLGYQPGAIHFIGVAARAPEHPDGRIWVRCKKCKAWNVFDQVASNE